MTDATLAEALKALSAPFELNQIELLPRFTGQKVQENGKYVIPRDAYKRCEECGGYHAFPCVHLSYVGHAGVTMRLLEVDPLWNWEPVATNEDGTPKLTIIEGKPGLW
ncbi:MAG: hypothetical protein HGA39_09575, partial [Coriobacteriia bacterium]|nr:hypothetical protein [Coriobacteriia bacterium]